MIYRYPHPEYFRDFATPDFKNIDGNLVLWGAGRIGGIAAHCLKKKGIEFSAFCDIASDKQGTEFCGHKVISPDELKRDYPDAVIIISTAFYLKVLEMLSKMGFKKSYTCASLFLEIDFEDYDFWMEPEYAARTVRHYLNTSLFHMKNKSIFDMLLLTVTTKCTLRCRNCDSFIPYLQAQSHSAYDVIMNSLNTVLSAIGYVEDVNFYGGEPMLHPELHKMLNSLRNDKRMGSIKIITNGTVLPSNVLLEAIKGEKRFVMRISNYGAFSSKIKELVSILDKNDIRYELTNYTYWDSLPKIQNAHETESELQSKFKTCRAGSMYIHNGRLCVCNTFSFIRDLNVIPDSGSNDVDLLKNDTSPEKLQREILEYLERLHTGAYLDACRYCSGSHCIQFENKVPVAEQTKELLTFEKLY